MSHQESGQWVSVDAVEYYRHQKEGKPDSVRVEYQCGLRRYREWWLPEHRGRARANTVMTLHEMGEQCPRSTDELLERADELPQPVMIYVEQEGKYERIKARHFAGEGETTARASAMA